MLIKLDSWMSRGVGLVLNYRSAGFKSGYKDSLWLTAVVDARQDKMHKHRINST